MKMSREEVEKKVGQAMMVTRDPHHASLKGIMALFDAIDPSSADERSCHPTCDETHHPDCANAKPKPVEKNKHAHDCGIHDGECCSCIGPETDASKRYEEKLQATNNLGAWTVAQNNVIADEREAAAAVHAERTFERDGWIKRHEVVKKHIDLAERRLAGLEAENLRMVDEAAASANLLRESERRLEIARSGLEKIRDGESEGRHQEISDETLKRIDGCE